MNSKKAIRSAQQVRRRPLTHLAWSLLAEMLSLAFQLDRRPSQTGAAKPHHFFLTTM